MYENWSVKKDIINYIGEDEEKVKQAQLAQEEYNRVANWCMENQQYTIYEDLDKYMVVTNEKMEQLMYYKMSEEEKKKYKIDKHNYPILLQINALEKEMSDNDYKQMKYLRGEYTEEEWAEIKLWFQEKARELSALREQLI